ncbi:hypothetical protein KKE60_04745 [Patescibacteria group bacterium]|nr:hypothetical protein [Patescibacteria group bacterium]
MLIKDFLEQADDPPQGFNRAPAFYLGLFLTILMDFEDEKCSVLLGKLKSSLTEDPEFEGRIKATGYLGGGCWWDNID